MGALNELYKNQLAEKILDLEYSNQQLTFRIEIEQSIIAKNEKQIVELKNKLSYAIQNGKGEAGQPNV